jgi:hypothetical protein
VSPRSATKITESSLGAAAKDAEHLELLRSLGLNSSMIVPLLAVGGHWVRLTFVTAESVVATLQLTYLWWKI